MVGSVPEWQVWTVGAAVVAFLLSVAVTLFATARAGAAGATAHTERELALQRQLRLEIGQQADALTGRLEAAERRLADSARDAETQRRQAEADLADARTEARRQVETHALEVQHALDALGTQLQDSRQVLRDLATRAEVTEHDLRRLQTQVALARSVGLAFKARTHLSEQHAGLAQHDLAALDAGLEQAAALATNGLRSRIDEARRSLGELRDGIEAKTFPVAAVELLADRLDDLIAA
jgi:chromosome segregation ATPase